MLVARGLYGGASACDFTLQEVFAAGSCDALYLSCPQMWLELKSTRRATSLLRAWEVPEAGGPCTVPRGHHCGLS